jgi:hypothetical protein
MVMTLQCDKCGSDKGVQHVCIDMTTTVALSSGVPMKYEYDLCGMHFMQMVEAWKQFLDQAKR